MNTNNNSSKQAQAKPIGFIKAFKEVWKQVSKKSDNKERKQTKRNQLSFVIFILSIVYSLDNYYLNSFELLDSNKGKIKYFLYSSVMSTVLVLFAYKNFISKFYYIVLPYFFKFVLFLFALGSRLYYNIDFSGLEYKFQSNDFNNISASNANVINSTISDVNVN